MTFIGRQRNRVLYVRADAAHDHLDHVGQGRHVPLVSQVHAEVAPGRQRRAVQPVRVIALALHFAEAVESGHDQDSLQAGREGVP